MASGTRVVDLLKASDLKRVDPATIGPNNCRHLRADDEVYYFLDYEPGSDPKDNPVANFIHNFKRCPHKWGSNSSVMWYKGEAVGSLSKLLVRISGAKMFWVYVPIPPSKAPDDEAYDSRLHSALNQSKVQWIDLITTAESRDAAHTSSRARDPQELRDSWKVEFGEIDDWDTLVVFDDVLTSGRSFRAASDALRELYPDHDIVGLFLAKTVPRPSENYEVDLSWLDL